MTQAVSARHSSSRSGKGRAQQEIISITVQGYKSIAEEVTVSIAPLTILAGTNSSGKSSLMQPILLMRQTLQAPYDPGALLLNGPNLKFTSAEQLFTDKASKETAKQFKVGMESQEKEGISCTFQKISRNPLDLSLTEYKFLGENQLRLSSEMNHDDLVKIFPKDLTILYENLISETAKETQKSVLEILDREFQRQEIEKDINSLFQGINDAQKSLKFGTIRNRCFFEPIMYSESSGHQSPVAPFGNIADSFKESIQAIIHVPGLRGNPERTYKTTAVGKEFPGIFENYVASIISHWQKTKDPRLNNLELSLKTVGLTSKIEAQQMDDIQVELKVGRLPCGSVSKNTKKDMVSIADVGFGVSQTLPVIVALLTAQAGQLIYIEQPEIHLHPRAQVAIAEVFADAANRGVRVVVETHSELFLMGVQSLVAEGKLAPDKVKLHWFTRQENGNTKITSADLDESGSFGEDWPEDFAEVSLSIQNRYLSAAEAKLWRS
jgi:predicted ATPase